MARQCLFLFGDLTADNVPPIRNLVSLSRTSHPLRRFLQDSIDVIQREAAKLPPDARKHFLAFEDLITLAEENAKVEVSNGIVNTTLISIARLGELIIHADNDPSILGSPTVTVHMLGLCTGLIPAAAAALANSTGDLHQYGLEMVAISVRLGHALWARSKQIEASPGTWASSCVGATAQDMQPILNRFHGELGIPEHRHAFMGVTSRTWTTVFGPPSVLEKLWTFSPELGNAPKLKLSIDGAVHAAHLPMLDIDTIIGDSALLNTPYPPDSQVISSSTSQPYKASDLRDLLFQMTLDIAQNTLRLTETVQTLVDNISQRGKDVDLIVLGPTAHTRMVQGALTEGSINVNLMAKADTIPTPHDLRGGSEKIAIVGMSGRFPGGENLQEFWDTLLAGADLHQKIPPSRFDLEEHYDPTGAKKSTLVTEHGCFLDNPGVFDSRLFNVSPREAMQMDPVQRLLLMVSYEAMEMAGYHRGGTLSTDPKRIATYMAQTTDDWREVTQTQAVDIYYIPGHVRAFTPGRINYHFKWEGASHSIDAACSGSSTTVQLACRALLSRECDTALAGGGAINCSTAAFAGCGRGGFLSPTGGCKTFRDDADGYCRGDGAGVVVMKRLEDAIADNDNILGVISGSARTYSSNAPSITAPCADSQAKIYKQVLHQACYDPNDIGYIEMHGTGTQLGDFTEMTSVCEVFSEGRPKSHPLVIGAVKANVGHGEAAAGVTSLIKCLLMFQHGGPVPPQPGMPLTLNHKYPPLDEKNIKISDGSIEFQPSPKGDGKKKMLLNNFDASGGNTCLALEEPPEPPQKRQDPREHHVVVCSARTPNSLRQNKQRLLSYLQYGEDINISDIGYTTTARRMHDVLRASYVARSPKDLASLIASDLEMSDEDRTQSKGSSIIFAFTGQGSIYAGMGKKLFETSSRFRESILDYQKICDFQGLPHVVDLIATGDTDPKYKSTVQLQLGIVFIELALADLWMSWGVQPDLLVGHSLGEYAAMCMAGVLSITDTLYLVGRRAMMMEEKCTPGSHAMLVVGASVESVEESLPTEGGFSYEISCINAPKMTVLSGKLDDLKKIKSKLDPQKIKTTFLTVSYGFHSAQIDPILQDLEAVATGITFAKPTIPIASTLTGQIVTDVGTFTPNYLARQAREPVKFLDALKACKYANLINDQTLWIEIGPDPICLGLVRSAFDVPSERLLPTIRSTEDSWKTISTCAAAVYTSKRPISWPEFHREYTDALTLLEIPTYAFDLKDYWVPFTRLASSPDPEPMMRTSTPEAPMRKHLETTSLQYVEKESFKDDEAEVILSAHTSDPKLFDAIQGHLVDNTPICPASVFCDMALTAARYTYMTGSPGKPEPHMSIFNMDITHALVVPRKNPEQIAEVIATTAAGSQWSSVQIVFKSREGAASHEHGSCTVLFGQSDDWKVRFSRSLPLVKRRMDDIVKSAIAGLGHRMQRPVVYKLFASLVDYSDNYRGLDEVFFDGDNGDAAARVKLRPSAGTGEFTLSPYWMDAVVHLAGFLLNGDLNLPKEIVFISSGFESFHLFDKLSAEKTYTSYVSMGPSEKKDVIVGDVYVFEGDKLVALCAGLLFNRLTKKVLAIIFNLDGKSNAAHQTPSKSKMVPVKQLPVHPANNTKTKQPVASSDTSSMSASGQSTKAPSSQTSVDDGTGEPDVADILLDIVASESGFAVADMHATTEFADMGVDSLMSIAIISAVRKQTGTDLGASFFDDHPTVSDVRHEFGKPLVQPAKATAPPPEVLMQPPEPIGITGEPDVADILLDIVASESGFAVADMDSLTLFADMGVDSLMSIAIISAVQKQTGTDLGASFFDDHPSVADVKREFGRSVPETAASVAPSKPTAKEPLHDTTESSSARSSGSNSPVMLTRDTSEDDVAGLSSRDKSFVDVAKSYVGMGKKTTNKIATPAPVPVLKARPAVPRSRAPARAPVVKAQATPLKPQVQRESNVVLIRGKASSKETPLFLATDGAGSATAYIHFPALSTGNRIYALESPYLPDPKDYNCSVEELCSLFCKAIRKTQPEGPYIIGGWSAGAAYAFEISKQMLSQGDQILGLILIDMRVPRPMPDALEPSLALIESAGLFTGIERSGNSKSSAAQRLKDHLVSTVTALVQYQPVAMDRSRRPAHNSIIWARNGLSEAAGGQKVVNLQEESDPTKTKDSGNVMEDADTGVRGWFYDKREVFGPNGWDKLVGDIDCHVLDGADHFSMVMPPKVKELGKILDKAVGKALASKK